MNKVELLRTVIVAQDRFGWSRSDIAKKLCVSPDRLTHQINHGKAKVELYYFAVLGLIAVETVKRQMRAENE